MLIKCIFVLQMLARSRLGLDLIAKDNFFFINQNSARQLGS